MGILIKSMSLKLNNLVNSLPRGRGEKEHIKNEGITRDVIENNGDENWHPVMLMKTNDLTCLPRDVDDNKCS